MHAQATDVWNSVVLQNRTLQQQRDLEVLEATVGQLEEVKAKQAHKIHGLQGELEETVKSRLSDREPRDFSLLTLDFVFRLSGSRRSATWRTRPCTR